MNPQLHPISFDTGLRLVLGHWRILAAVTAGALLCAVGYILVVPDTWVATQAITVRDEAALEDRPENGYGEAEARQNLQETILELANDPKTLQTVLKSVGPPSDHSSDSSWPTRQDVEDFSEAVTIAPPRGSEFGASDIFYVHVKSADRNRAIALVDAVREQLQLGFQKMRNDRVSSIIAELEATVETARANLDSSTVKVSKIEAEIGSDLGELRGLHNSLSADSSLRRTASEIETELRQARTAEDAGAELAEILRAAEKDPGRLLAAPNQLLESQPALRRLKDGLIDAQLATASLQGRMSEAHPIVQASIEEEKNIGENLHGEIAIALRGVEMELRLSRARCKMLENRLSEISRRLNDLARLRTPYSNALQENESRTELLRRAEDALVSAKAKLAGANASTLLAAVGEPDTGARPVGPGKSIILAGGMAAGSALGLGIILLTGTVPPPKPVERKASVRSPEWHHPLTATVAHYSPANGGNSVTTDWRSREKAMKTAFRQG